jgi:hypothetical protein
MRWLPPTSTPLPTWRAAVLGQTDSMTQPKRALDDPVVLRQAARIFRTALARRHCEHCGLIIERRAATWHHL